MAELLGNEKKKLDLKKIGGILGVITLLVVVYLVVSGGKDDSIANVSDSNTVKQLKNENLNYDGSTKKVDESVKVEKEESVKRNREKAAEKKGTQIESVPLDSEYVKDAKSQDVNQLLTEKEVVCVTTDFDENGYHCKTGFDRQGFDREGYDKNGFNKQGCNRKGVDISGKPCGNFLNAQSNECLDKLMKNCEADNGFNDGYDKDGYDKQGFDRQGFNRQGCDRQNYDKDGFHCITKLNRNGFDRNGCDKDGYDKEGYSCSTKLNKEGYDKEGYDKDGFNKEGCNREGFTREGKTCKGKGTKVALTPDERVWYDNLLASKQSYYKELEKKQTPYAMDLEVIREDAFESNIITANKAKENEKDKNNNDGNNSNGDTTTPDDKPVNNPNIEVPTGAMLYGQIQASLNSDYPGMVRVKVLGGPLDQSMMMGAYTVPFLEDSYRPRDKIKIALNKMVYQRNTFTINAVALDTQSMTDYLTGEVDYHYFTRWGGLIAANVLKGIGRAVATTGQSASNDGSGMIYQQPITATGDQLKVAAGEVGNELSTIAREQFDRPPTVTKDQGEMVAIFFMEEINDDRLPMIFDSREMAEIAEKSKLNPNATFK